MKYNKANTPITIAGGPEIEHLHSLRGSRVPLSNQLPAYSPKATGFQTLMVVTSLLTLSFTIYVWILMPCIFAYFVGCLASFSQVYVSDSSRLLFEAVVCFHCYTFHCVTLFQFFSPILLLTVIWIVPCYEYPCTNLMSTCSHVC